MDLVDLPVEKTPEPSRALKRRHHEGQNPPRMSSAVEKTPEPSRALKLSGLSPGTDAQDCIERVEKTPEPSRALKPGSTSSVPRSQVHV